MGEGGRAGQVSGEALALRMECEGFVRGRQLRGRHWKAERGRKVLLKKFTRCPGHSLSCL